jgi:hypothetical protein
MAIWSRSSIDVHVAPAAIEPLHGTCESLIANSHYIGGLAPLLEILMPAVSAQKISRPSLSG